MHRGTVVGFNQKRQTFIVKDDNSIFSYFRSMAPLMVDVGDRVEWTESAQRTVLRNSTKNLDGLHVDDARYGLYRSIAEALLTI
jgi:hypothetical protein